MLDISEDPRWGRVAASLGEAAVLSGRLGAVLVRGFQTSTCGQSGTVAACAKHFVGYGLVAGGRDYDTVQVGENSLRNLHMRPFRDAVRAGCATVMAASFVLLTNNGALPLEPSPGRVLLTGPFAREGEALLGTWTLDGRGQDVASPAAAIRERLGEDAIIDDGHFSDRTMHLVRPSDVTVALVGEHPARSGEANSVADTGLPAGQLEVLRAMAAMGEPRVVVVFTGRPLDLGDVLDLADAVLIVWHPGIEAGPALIETLFGDRSPGGRLPMTFPCSLGHVHQARLLVLPGGPSPQPRTAWRAATSTRCWRRDSRSARA